MTLILGGTRSGKSTRAQALATRSGRPVVFVATAPHLAHDPDWEARIASHRRTRPPEWATVEAPIELAAALEKHARPSGILLVDCLTLWLSNLLHAGCDLRAEEDRLATCLSGLPGDVLLVSNEVGLGVHPESALGRGFRDAQGRLNQRIAALADRVEWVVAGLPQEIKGPVP